MLFISDFNLNYADRLRLIRITLACFGLFLLFILV